MTDKNKPTALLFFMPGYGVSPNNYGYFFKGRHFDKLGGASAFSLENSYDDQNNFNKLLYEKETLKNY